MKLIVDPEIPLITNLLAEHFEIHYLKNDEIRSENLNDAAILICRSTLKITKNLINHSHLSIIATPSSGSDHVDKTALRDAGIQFYASPGCNAASVADYVSTVIAAAWKEKKLPFDGLTAGIIGFGHVGQQVAQRLHHLKIHCLLNDPPRAISDKENPYHSLEALYNCDIITLHTPLEKQGKFPTYHLIDHDFLSRCKPGCLIINAARGTVIDETAIQQNSQHHYIIDVFANEPSINHAIAQQAFIATPHIAGHALTAKYRGAWMIAQQILQHFNLPLQSEPAYPEHHIDCHLNHKLEDILLQTYDPRMESIQLKQSNAETLAATFLSCRKAHRQRHEFSKTTLSQLNHDPFANKILQGLGFNLDQHAKI